MAAVDHDTLRKFWLEGKNGAMSPKDQAKAWALREAWKALGKPNYGMLTFICQRIQKVGGGNPGKDALGKFFNKVDEDADWFPGKTWFDSEAGRPTILTNTNRSVAARSLMSMKAGGDEPCYAKAVAHNPNALLNPETGVPFSKKVVYGIMANDCYDDPDHPEDTWSHQTRYSQDALTDLQINQRWDWMLWMEGLNHQAAWYFRHLVWTDICNTILPRTQKRSNEMVLANKGKKGWGSKGSMKKSINRKGKDSAKKQNSWDALRVWWLPILSRGKLHIEVVGDGFPGDKPAGAKILVQKVRAVLNVRFPDADKPDILFADRGRGFFNASNGKITKQFKEALEEHDFRTFNGDDGSKQPGALGDVLLHETAVSWIRKCEERSRLARPWEESVDDFKTRMREICQDINNRHDVEGLCRQLPRRLEELRESEGDKIPH